MELKKTTKSSSTLNKHLKQMIEHQTIEKKIDTECGEYPHPVLYKAHPEIITYIKMSMFREEFYDKIGTILKESNDPLMILDIIHNWSQLTFIKILEQIQKDKNINFERKWKRIEYLGRAFLWANYEFFTLDLITATLKIINEIDINKLLIAQAKRQKEMATNWYNILEDSQKTNSIK